LTSIDLSWAESFWRGIMPYVHLRKEDRLLILPPNRVYKLNETGYGILSHLSRGGRLSALPLSAGDRLNETNAFFDSLRRVYDGEDSVTERIPYDFDFTRLPILGEIALTYRCNHACLFCYAGCGSGQACATGPLAAASAKGITGPGRGAKPAQEMTSRQVRKIIDIFKEKAQIPFFSFTGGEPTLRPDLPELVRYGKKKGFRVNLITNGTLSTPALCAALKAAGLDSVQVSIEAPEAVLHDRLTARTGSFERALAGIKAFQDEGIPVQTNTTLTRLNSPIAASMPAFLDSIGVKRFSMNIFIPSGQGAVRGADPNTDALFLPYAEVGEIVESVRRQAHLLGMAFYWYSPTPFCHYNPVARGLGNKNCAAMDGLVSVSPSGDVLPCSSYPEPMGNLLRAKFEDVWFSARASHFKQKRYAPEECAGCGSFTACQSACPLYWKYAGTEELRGRNPALKRMEAS
jgi:radical SAM protein with 4Fe4S-binding SPASM domain